MGEPLPSTCHRKEPGTGQGRAFFACCTDLEQYQASNLLGALWIEKVGTLQPQATCRTHSGPARALCTASVPGPRESVPVTDAVSRSATPMMPSSAGTSSYSLVPFPPSPSLCMVCLSKWGQPGRNGPTSQSQEPASSSTEMHLTKEKKNERSWHC